MTTPQLSRRSLVAGAAALSSLAVPTLSVAGAVSEPDPIFAVIDTHRSALFVAMRALKIPNEMPHSDPRYPTAWAESLSADDAERCAQFELSRVVPTTWAGMFALMEYVEALYSGKVGIPEDPAYYARVDDNGEGYDHWIRKFEAGDLLSPYWGTPLPLPLIFWVMRNVRTALRTLSASHGEPHV